MGDKVGHIITRHARQNAAGETVIEALKAAIVDNTTDVRIVRKLTGWHRDRRPRAPCTTDGTRLYT
tara:strand:+ start:157 stop:354 length:198 start_codon:yes stop_codon:yes gene_type:complete